jgi:hypothetical protein
MEIRTSGKVVEVVYGPDEQVTVERQHDIKAVLVETIRKHPVGLLVHVPRSLRKLDVSVGAYWMGVMRELAPGFRAMAAVTNTPGLRILADSFSKTLSLVGAKVPIRVFDGEAAARAWLDEVV